MKKTNIYNVEYYKIQKKKFLNSERERERDTNNDIKKIYKEITNTAHNKQL